ncbi:hypothetical protein F4775DRAFT_589769 [Biscogniauxia sp. FL1348]|nr:hypothetical protein F4775DRAFT_589769 [Biscogniauxia sp. FL1348]
MAPIGYSKWDDIDTDSEPEASPNKFPNPPPLAAAAAVRHTRDIRASSDPSRHRVVRGREALVRALISDHDREDHAVFLAGGGGARWTMEGLTLGDMK